MRFAAPALATAAAAAALVVNSDASIGRIPVPPWDRLFARFWEDTHLAQSLYLFGEFPVSANDVVLSKDADGVVRYSERHPHVSRTTEEAGVARWQFWRVVRENRFRRPAERFLVDRYDDSGRPMLVGLGYRALGGISPYLMFWLGVVLAVPLLGWSAAELAAAGRPAAGAGLALLLGFSPFLADAATLTYSTAGFHVLAVVAGVPLVSYALLHPRPSATGLAVRSTFCGLVLGMCILARGGALLTLAGPVLALGVAGARVPATRRMRAVVVLGALALLVLPYLSARLAVQGLVARTTRRHGRESLAPQRHAFWFGMWTGLGDFDRSHGHRWLDAAASAAGVAAGAKPLRFDGYDPANEPIFRRLVLDAIRSDPGWYAGVLMRRALATLAQRKLWPWPPLGGRSIAPADHPNEGAIDAYYALVTPADRLGLWTWQVEVPIPVLALPAGLVLIAPLFRRWRRHAGDAAVVALIALAALPLPVLVTTAGAIEPQAFVVVYFLGLALLADTVLRRAAARNQGVQASPLGQSR